MGSKILLIAVIVFFVLVILFISGAEKKSNAAKIGDTVSVHYTGKFQNSTVFDSSVGKQPLTFTIGSGQVIEGFDDAVVGMSAGEKKTVSIPPEKAYGFSGHPLAGQTLIFDITLVEIRA